jgi:hypothetical protein
LLKSENVIEKFKLDNSHRNVTTFEPIIRDVNPQKIIGINEVYNYPEILEDYKMKKLKDSYAKNGWKDKTPQTLDLLEFPDGSIIVNGNGNHRAVLAKVKSLSSIKANLQKVVYHD